jgi:hypothetical protein
VAAWLRFMKLGGTMVMHNCIRYDYCHEQALNCLLELCDEVVVVDGESDDGTWEWLRATQAAQPKLKLYQRAWGGTKDEPWLNDFCNFARAQLTTPMHFFLCPDEMLDARDYDAIRASADNGQSTCYRFVNFWGSEETFIPVRVVRLAPAQAKCIRSSGELEAATPQESDITIYHYGFLRKATALAAKARKHQMLRLGHYDPIFDEVERVGIKALTNPAFVTAVYGERLTQFKGTHPVAIHKWLQERGYKV